MNTKQLFKHFEKPPLFERGNASMWEDPYISKQLLKFHLDSDCGLASRSPEVIDKTVKWMVDNYLKKTDKILDIGCGPGLYTTRLARLAFNVTGLDFSKNSIEYARTEAEKENFKIDYIHGSYLDMDFKNEFDVITIIFCDFGALTNSERDVLLQNVYRALKPGGKFIFDIYTESPTDQEKNHRTWDYNENAFWAEEKHIALSQNFYYPEEKVGLSQHIVLTEDDNIKDYRFFNHNYDEKTISTVLKNNGFKNFEFKRGLAADNNGSKDIEVLFTKAEK
jgi:SAM-dependent methyltransferase